MAGVVILDPVGHVLPQSHSLAERPTSLVGLRIGFLHNGKPGGEVVLEALKERMQSELRPAAVVWRRKTHPSAPASFLDELARECDVVIAAVGD